MRERFFDSHLHAVESVHLPSLYEARWKNYMKSAVNISPFN
jgi:hypothetical protein